MRSKLWLVCGVAVAGGLALYGATQVWVTLSLAAGAAASGWLEVTGQQVNQSLSPVAIAALAAALALTIAGRVFRRLLGVLVLLLGAGIAAIAVSVVRDPGAAVAGRLAEATGLEGPSQTDLVTSLMVSPLVAVTVAAGAALVLLGLLILFLGGRWRTGGRRYEADSGRARVVADEPDRISDWEALNDGDDPTRSS